MIISRTLSKFYGLPGLRMGFGFMSKELENFSRYSNKYLGYNRISEDIAIAALKSDTHYRNIAKLMNEDRERYEKEIGVLPGFKVYASKTVYTPNTDKTSKMGENPVKEEPEKKEGEEDAD